jgi:hypothetical protein
MKYEELYYTTLGFINGYLMRHASLNDKVFTPLDKIPSCPAETNPVDYTISQGMFPNGEDTVWFADVHLPEPVVEFLRIYRTSANTDIKQLFRISDD